MAVDGSLNFNTEVDTKGFNKGTKEVSSSVGELKGMLGGFAKAAAAAFSVKMITDFGKQAVESAASVNAANSQVTQTFGELESSARSVFKQIGSEAGILDTRLQGTGTSIYAFAKASGMESAEAMSMMEEALRVTADSAAYYDRSLEDVGESLKSFLKGNYANDAALGVSCTETTRNIAANRLYGKSFQDLSEAQKQLVLLDMVSEANKLSGAEGQAAREAEGWENVTGNLKEAWNQFLAVVGQPVLSVAVKVVQSLTEIMTELTEVARDAAEAVAGVFGIELQSASSAAQGTAQSARSTAKSAQSAAESYTEIAEESERTEEAQENSLASFDKVIKLEDNSAKSQPPAAAQTAGGTGAAATPIAFDTKTSERQLSGFGKKVKSILESVRKSFDKVFGGSFSGIWDGLLKETKGLLKTFKGVFSDLASLGEPLLQYFSTSFLPAFSTVFTTIGNILTGLLNTFTTVFSDIWNIAVFPMLQSFLTVGLPMITEFWAGCWEVIGVAFDVVKGLFDMLWADVAEPTLSLIATVWEDTWQSLSDFWDKWGAPIFESIKEAVTVTGEIIEDLWKKWLKPVADRIFEVCGRIWTEHLKPLLDNFLDFCGELINGVIVIYNKVLAPIVKWVIDWLSPIVTSALRVIVDVVSTIIETICDLVDGLITTVKGVIQFIVGVFTGDWEKAWEGVKNIFKGIWDTLVAIVKFPLNLMIDLINGLLYYIQEGMNWVIGKINSLSFDVPDWVPGIGGETFGFDLDYFELPQIPHLAQGTVIPANYGEFAAVLGDNKREAEVVSPISAMKQAFREALAEGGGKQTIIINLSMDTRRGRKLLSQQVIDDINDIINSTGTIPIDL